MMETWSEVPIKEVAFFQEGPGLRNWQWTDDGMKVINGRNILLDGTIDLSNTDKFISLEEFNRTYRHFEIQENDIVLTSSGTLGKVGRVKAEHLPLMMNTSVIRFRSLDPDILDDDFLFSYLRSPEFQEKVLTYAIGAAQANFGPSHLKLMSMPLPPIGIQRRIAGILSAYDELIANNQRRIAILEEMARALYREWFVHYRAPGVVMGEDGVPEGWEVREFRDLFDIRYGKTLPKTEISDAGDYPVYGAGDVIGFYHKMLHPEKCALVTSRGNGSGTVWRTREAAFITNNSLLMLPKKELRHWDYSFIELLLMNSNVMEARTGSAQPQVTIENLNYVKGLLPAKHLVERFCAIATPLYDQVDALHQVSSNLRRTRDLLLPRLMSGRVEFELSEQ
jgi:type I restriction enzyme S subunit